MDESFIPQRITQLRIEKNVSEYKMSIDLGHSKGYIQSITSGRAMPSMYEFFNICDYFDITPKDFFTIEQDSNKKKTLKTMLDGLSHDDLDLLTQLIDRLNSEKD